LKKTFTAVSLSECVKVICVAVSWVQCVRRKRRNFVCSNSTALHSTGLRSDL